MDAQAVGNRTPESQVARQLRWALRPLQPLLDDRETTDLHINGAGPDGQTRVFIKRNGKRERRVITLTAKALHHIGANAAVLGRSLLTERMPFSTGKLPDGQRVQIVGWPAVAEGKMALSIRRGSARPFTPQELEDLGVFEITVAAEHAPERPGVRRLLELKAAGRHRLFIETAFAHGFSGVFAGPVNSGKTTNLQAFLHAVSVDKRIITVEDTEEITEPPQADVVNLLYPKDVADRHSAENCIEAGLRMDMDEIVNGEVRDGAVWALMRAGAGGHPFKSSCHAASALGAFDALLLMAKQHPTARALETADLMQTLRVLVDFVVFSEVIDGRRRVTQIWFDPSAKTGLPKHAAYAISQGE